MVKDDLVVLAPGADARQRLARLSARAEELLPVMNAEWEATVAAAAAFEAELPYPLTRLVEEATAALERRPMRRRIADAAPGLLPTAD
jgi:hypothetical protein